MKKLALIILLCSFGTTWAQFQTFTTVGTHTFTPHTSVIEATFEAIGAGGGGGRVHNASGTNHKAAGGGGGGAYVRSFINVAGGNTYNVVVGAGGYNTSSSSQVNGGDTYFDSGIEAKAAGGFTKMGDGANNSPGAQGGQASSCVSRHLTGTSNTAFAYSGGNGGTGDDGCLTCSSKGGGGGGAAGSTGKGNDGGRTGGGSANNGSFFNNLTYGGNGGNGYSGSGNGYSGNSYGGGGGGASAQGSTNRNGGTGGSGIAIIYWSEIHNLSASSGCPGDIITINGNNFINVSSVTFNGVAATINSFTSTSINVTVPSSSSGDIIVTTQYGRSKAAFTYAATPSAPSAITGNTLICAAGSQTYSVTAVPNTTSYTWTLPSGWSGSSTTNSISATTNGNGGTISVIANGSCGSSTATTLTVNAGVAPNQPSSISGNSSICAGTANTYSVTADPNATSYTWTLPSGWSGTSTSNSISVNANNTAGTISVTASNACGNSSASSLAVTVVGAAPSQPALTNGNVNLCAGSSDNFEVNLDPTASYTWTLSGDLSGSSTSNTIAITSGPIGGTAQVIATNICGSSSPETISINPVNTPNITNASITGNILICANSTQSYTVINAQNASSYTWTLPSGWSGSSTTNSIQVTAGNSNGTISVTANNACGNSAAISLPVSITPLPNQPSTITGNTLICSLSPETYTVPNDPSVTSYTWTLPSGWSGTSTTNAISATPGGSGIISVIANGACGSSSPSTLLVSSPGIASNIMYQIACGSYSINGETFNQSGTYSQVLTTSSGCDSNITLYLTILSNVNPAVTTSGGKMTAAETNAYYQWIDCNTNTPIQFATEKDFYPKSNGQYAVIVTKNGCTDTSSCIAMNSVSTQDYNTNISVVVYPNPTDDITYITINNTSINNDLQLSLYDISGKIIYQQELKNNMGNNTFAFQTSDLAAGVYFIQVSSQKAHLIHEKLIIKH